MGDKYLLIDSDEVLEIYFGIIDEEIEDVARQELFEIQTAPSAKSQENRLSIFKLCNPFWLTYALLKGIFYFLWTSSTKPEFIYVTAKPDYYRNINHWSDDDDQSEKYFLVPLRVSKCTQTEPKDIPINKIENALGDLITLRKFRDIVPSNRKTVKRMASCHSLKPFKSIDRRNRQRFGGKIVKPKLSKSTIFYRKRNRKKNNQQTLDVHDVMNHLLYIESSDEESDY